MSPLFDRRILLGLVFILLVGCSGGGSGTGAQDQNQTTVGEITGFGSVYVSGIHFNTDMVTVDSDDQISGDVSNLSVGMIVKVVGTVSPDGTEGVAEQIFMTTAVEGLVFSLDLANDKFNVMGQTINITNDTRFNPTTGININDFSELQPGVTAVEVHGYTDGLGEFFATMVEVVENSGVASEVKLLGKIQNFAGNSTNGSFMIGAMTIQYSGSTSFEDGLLVTDLMDDLYVSVEGAPYNGVGSVQATEIEPANQAEEEGTGYELEGVVTDITNLISNEFSLNGQPIVFDINTLFEGGPSTDIQLEVELEVEGVFQLDGSILAHEISFHTESDMENEGIVTDVGANTITINGTSGSLVLTVNELTSYEDEVGGNQFFYFDDITTGMYIGVKYYSDGMNNIATRVEQTTP